MFVSIANDDGFNRLGLLKLNQLLVDVEDTLVLTKHFLRGKQKAN